MYIHSHRSIVEGDDPSPARVAAQVVALFASCESFQGVPASKEKSEMKTFVFIRAQESHQEPLVFHFLQFIGDDSVVRAT
jgi:hypothetical protein